MCHVFSEFMLKISGIVVNTCIKKKIVFKTVDL